MHLKRFGLGFLTTLNHTNKNFVSVHGAQYAAELSYTTLLSVVPMTGLLFFFSLQIELFSSMFEQVREQLLLQLLPTSREQVEAYLLQTTKNIKSFSYFGIVIIFLSAIWMSVGVERALNHIWHVKVARKLSLRIPAHITLWLLTPVLLVLSISVSTWLTSIPYIGELSQQTSKSSHLIPWSISSVALFLLYYFVPNTKVHFLKACISAIFSSLLFEVSKWGFTIFITEYAMYEKLYGALAALPIFMLWVFISWVIILWGAMLCSTMQSGQRHS